VTELDSWNFDKIVDGSKAVLVWVYNAQAPGSYQQTAAMKRLGERFSQVNSGFLCKVDAVSHPQLAERLRVQTGVLFFPPGELTPVKYSGQIASSELADFIEGNTKLLKHGQVEKMGPYARRFMAARGSNARRMRTKVVREASSLSIDHSELRASRKHAEEYVKVMKKITEHGDDWLMSEIARLKRLASNKHNSSHKLVELRALKKIQRQAGDIA